MVLDFWKVKVKLQQTGEKIKKTGADLTSFAKEETSSTLLDVASNAKEQRQELSKKLEEKRKTTPFYVFVKNWRGQWEQKDTVYSEEEAEKVSRTYKEQVKAHKIKTFLVTADPSYAKKFMKAEKYASHERRLKAQEEISAMPRSRIQENLKTAIKPEGVTEFKREMSAFSEGPSGMPRMQVPAPMSNTLPLKPQKMDSDEYDNLLSEGYTPEALSTAGIERSKPLPIIVTRSDGSVSRVARYKPIGMETFCKKNVVSSGYIDRVRARIPYTPPITPIMKPLPCQIFQFNPMQINESGQKRFFKPPIGLL